jgi:hypothetical protein
MRCARARVSVAQQSRLKQQSWSVMRGNLSLMRSGRSM